MLIDILAAIAISARSIDLQLAVPVLVPIQPLPALPLQQPTPVIKDRLPFGIRSKPPIAVPPTIDPTWMDVLPSTICYRPTHLF